MTGLQGGPAVGIPAAGIPASGVPASGIPDSEVILATLDALHPLALPPAPTWWPQTPASLLVVSVFGLMLLVLGVRAWQRWQAQAYRREALGRLGVLRAALNDPATREPAAREIPELLRCTALAVWPRAQISQLSGAAWLAFLDQTLGRANQPFSAPGARVLLELAYLPSQRIDWAQLPALLDLVACWVRSHRPELGMAMQR